MQNDSSNTPDAVPASQPAVSQPNAQEAQSPTPDSSTVPPLTSGFPLSHLAVASVLLRALHVGGQLDEKVKEVVHVPKARTHIAKGFEVLATTQGLLFKQLCELWNFEVNNFYDACDSYLNKQNELLMQLSQPDPKVVHLDKEQTRRALNGQKP